MGDCLQRRKNSSLYLSYWKAAQKSQSNFSMVGLSNYSTSTTRALTIGPFNCLSTMIMSKEAVACLQHFSSCPEADSALLYSNF